ncbi:MAG TPA: YpdA family putative bacillithiol disulfide reductase [Gemmatimonadales bacterium]|nr:YpdA family putative bacillithiol disulfide reductase [Gemmatimonadales bacterium]
MSSHESTLIVGAGPIGLACAISARKRGGNPLLVDAGAIADAIVRYPVGMVFFTTPERLEIGGHPLVTSGAKATREEALKYYRGVARSEALRIRTYTRFAGAIRKNGRLECRLVTRLAEERLSVDRLVLATGYFDHPNRLAIPGEDLPHVSHYGAEPHLTSGLHVVIVGGKNSAVEQALASYRAGASVTLVYRGPTLKPSVKYWLRPDFDNRVKAGEIDARFDAVVERIDPDAVTIRIPSGTERLAADRVFLLTGYHPDFELFESLGITLDPMTGRPALDPVTLETNVPGIHLAGSVTAGRMISEIFIENGRYDGEKIFGDPARGAEVERAYRRDRREVGE